MSTRILVEIISLLSSNGALSFALQTPNLFEKKKYILTHFNIYSSMFLEYIIPYLPLLEHAVFFILFCYQ